MARTNPPLAVTAIILWACADAAEGASIDARETSIPDLPSDTALDSSFDSDALPDTVPPDTAPIEDTPDVAPSDVSDVDDVAPDTTPVPDIAPDSGTEPDTIDTTPRDPVAVFGSRYWNVYRPHFLAHHYDEGRVNDRIEAQEETYGDTTLWMGYALTTFTYEYLSAFQPESLAYLAEILDAYAELDAMPADPTFGYLVADPLDGYIYRSDRGPDYETNWCLVVQGVCVPQLATRDNEPSGDQILSTLRGLYDVVHAPVPLVHEGRDLKAVARLLAERLGDYLVRMRFIMKNPLGQEVKRGPDQRWLSWAFQQGAANVTGLPKSRFEASWTIGPFTVEPPQHEVVGLFFLKNTLTFSRSCIAGQKVELQPLIGIPLAVDVDCNEFNVGLGGDAGVISLDADPASPRWFSTVIDRTDLVREGNSLYALYAIHRFNDDHPDLVTTAARFLSAPATPPRADNLDPNGWCVPWRWAKDFDDPNRCIDAFNPFASYSGLDYMIARAMSTYYGVFPE